MLKGTATIELTDVNTGEVETIYEENMVTTIIEDILSTFPYGTQYYDNGIDGLLPVIPNAIGGIALFGESLIENENNYYAEMSNPIIGYSDNIADKGTDPKKGEMNVSESTLLRTSQSIPGFTYYLNKDQPSGFQFVFDFATDRAIGEIHSIALTSKQGGKAMYGSSYVADRSLVLRQIHSRSRNMYALSNDQFYFDFDVDNVENLVPKGELYYTDDQNSGPTTYENYLTYIISNITAIDFDNNCAYSVLCTGTKSITVFKLFIPQNKVGLFDNPYFPFKIIGSKTFTAENFAATRITSSYFNGTFVKGVGNEIWGFQYSGNAEAASGTTKTLLWVRIDCDNMTMQEGSWNLSGLNSLYRLGRYYYGSSSFPTSGTNYVVIKSEKYLHEGQNLEQPYLYIINGTTSSNHMSGVYKIPIPKDEELFAPPASWLETIQDSLITGTTTYLINNIGGSSGGDSGYISNFQTYVNVIGNTVYYPCCYIGGSQTLTPQDDITFLATNSTKLLYSTLYNTSSQRRFPGLSDTGKPNLYYGPYLLSFSYYSNTIYFKVYLATQYLATINNLEHPIVKTQDKTMKITYTIQEVS